MRITIYKTHSGFCNVPDFFRFDESYDADEIAINLPAGYSVEESNGGTRELYNKNGNHCTIVQHSSGHAQIIDPDSKKQPVLKPIA